MSRLGWDITFQTELYRFKPLNGEPGCRDARAYAAEADAAAKFQTPERGTRVSRRDCTMISEDEIVFVSNP